MTNNLRTASDFVAAGIAVIPIHPRDKRPEFSMLPVGEDGRPSWEPFKTVLPDTEQLAAWFSRPINYGVVCGWQGLVVLDFDQIGAYNQWLLWAGKSGGIARYVANHAFRVTTARGVHVYIRLPHKEKTRKLPGIDVKGDGYVLGPGSIHPSGAIYTPMRAVFNFSRVQALSDVLPAEQLITEQAAATSSAAPCGGTWQPRAATPAPGAGLVKKIQSAVRIEDLLSGVQLLHQTGKGWYITTCPLHDDHNPSFWINTEQQICGCFSGCTDKPLDAINLYARMHGLSNGEAIRVLAQQV